MKSHFVFWLLGIGLFATIGCGPDTSKLPKTVKAEGIVTLDGNAVDGAQVVLVPEDPSGTGAYGSTDKSGRFSLRAFEQKTGAVPGKYKAQVSKTIQVKLEGTLDGGDAVRFDFAVPAKYTGTATSGLTCEIPESGAKDIKLELSSK